jgi:hypothetical protein
MKRCRAPSKLSESVHHRLNMYAIAASATGVGMFALGHSAEAKIVYTPANVTIAPNAKLNLDLNNDGAADFYFSDASHQFSHTTFGVLKIKPWRRNAIWGAGTSASALPSGTRIGPPGKFRQGHDVMAERTVSCGGSGTCTSFSYGPWTNASRRYLGLKFLFRGQVHYGWARLTVDTKGRVVKATLTGYAYETVPNKPITAGKEHEAEGGQSFGQPKPASRKRLVHAAVPLGLLAAGWHGTRVSRQKRCSGTR